MRIRRFVTLVVISLLAALTGPLLTTTSASAAPVSANVNIGVGKLANASVQYDQAFSAVVNAQTREASLAYLLSTAGPQFRSLAERVAAKAAAGDKRCAATTVNETLKMINTIEQKKQWTKTTALLTPALQRSGKLVNGWPTTKTTTALNGLLTSLNATGNNLYITSQSRAILTSLLLKGC